MRVYISGLCWCLVIAVVALAKPVGNEKPGDGVKLTPFEGVWEQVELQTKNETVEKINRTNFNLLKLIVVVKDNKYFSVGSAGIGLRVSSHRLSMHPDGAMNAVDLHNPDDNRKVRCLYEAKDDNLALCWHSGGKTMSRPKKIEATKDGFDVNLFKRLQAPANKASAAKVGDKRLTGLWETVGYEIDGAKLENADRIEDKERFLKSKKVLYFEDNTYTMIVTDETGGLVVSRRHYHVTPKENKLAIDIVREDGQNVPAIYELKDDRLRICWNWNGTSRPDQFRTQQDDGLALITLKRFDK